MDGHLSDTTTVKASVIALVLEAEGGIVGETSREVEARGWLAARARALPAPPTSRPGAVPPTTARARAPPHRPRRRSRRLMSVICIDL